MKNILACFIFLLSTNTMSEVETFEERDLFYLAGECNILMQAAVHAKATKDSAGVAFLNSFVEERVAQLGLGVSEYITICKRVSNDVESILSEVSA